MSRSAVRGTPILLAAVLFVPVVAQAQVSLATARLGATVPRTAAADSLQRARVLASFAPLGYASAAAPDDPRLSDRSFQAFVGVGTGLLVGGFLGYFVSQVGTSDWENLSTTERSRMRTQYAVSGAGIGAVTGYFMRPRKLRLGKQPVAAPLPNRAGRQLLTSIDLRRSLATNMLEAIELERPEWLQSLPRPLDVPPADTASVPSRSLVVYLGIERVGGVATLRDVSLSEVQELRLYDAREAEQKWGVEHRYGAIEIVTPTSAAAETTVTGARPAPTP